MPILLHNLISDTAHSLPENTALQYKDIVLNYQQLNDKIIAISNAFIQLGIKRSERIGIYLPKRIETIVSIFSASAADAVFVPINPILKAKQVAYILNDCNVRLLITTHTCFKQL